DRPPWRSGPRDRDDHRSPETPTGPPALTVRTPPQDPPRSRALPRRRPAVGRLDLHARRRRGGRSVLLAVDLDEREEDREDHRSEEDPDEAVDLKPAEDCEQQEEGREVGPAADEERLDPVVGG